MYLVSACLLGQDSKYNGGNNRNEAVIRFAERHSVFPVCPETTGGLPVPRPPAERVGKRVVNREGEDVTVQFLAGARSTLSIALAEAERRGERLEGAILKANSPSCGSGVIYDGTFTGNIIDGNGCFTELLNELGIKVITEKELDNND